MLNFFISIVVFAVSTFLLAFSVRYGMIGAERLDRWLSIKSGQNFQGYDWYYRIPFRLGAIPEYFYAIVLQRENYYKTNWWALKTSSFLAVLLFIALLQNRNGVINYYTLGFLKEEGITAFFTSGNFIWYLNFLTLMYLGLAVLLLIESIKVARHYAPLRIIYYGFLCFIIASLTIAVLTTILFIAVIYILFKVIKFLFFSNKNTEYDEDETAQDIFQGGFSQFRKDLVEWEKSRKSNHKNRRSKQKPKTKRKPIITRRKRTVKHKPEEIVQNDDIPRLHPD